MLKNLFFAGMFAMAFFVSCDNKSNDPVPASMPIVLDTCLLTETTINGTKDLSIIYSNNRVNMFIEAGDTSIITYNSNNFPVKAQHLYNNQASDYEIYHYDNNGWRDVDTLFTLISPPSTYDTTYTIRYTYTNGLITQSDQYTLATASHRITTYTYDANGDISKDVTDVGSGNILTNTYTYDSYNSFMPVFSFSDPFEFSRRHNILSKVSDINGSVDPGSWSIVYTYNKEGYPVSGKRTHNDGTVENETYTYFCK